MVDRIKAAVTQRSLASPISPRMTGSCIYQRTVTQFNVSRAWHCGTSIPGMPVCFHNMSFEGTAPSWSREGVTGHMRYFENASENAAELTSALPGTVRRRSRDPRIQATKSRSDPTYQSAKFGAE
jgi:hypothetical protein